MKFLRDIVLLVGINFFIKIITIYDGNSGEMCTDYHDGIGLLSLKNIV